MTITLGRTLVIFFTLLFTVLFSFLWLNSGQNLTPTDNVEGTTRFIELVAETPQQGKNEDLVLHLQNEPESQATNSDVWTIMEPIEWQFEGQLKDHLPRLLSLAKQDDAVASYILGKNLQRCLFVPVDNDQFERKQVELSAFNDAGESLIRLTERYVFCEEITEEQRSQYFVFLNKSAHLDSVFAMEAIAKIPTQLYMRAHADNDLARDQFIALRDDFENKKRQYIQTASQNGSEYALKKWAREHYNQNFGQNGKRHAYAINQVILALTDNIEIYNRYDWYQQKLYKELSSEDIDAALEIATKLLGKIQKNGTLYREES